MPYTLARHGRLLEEVKRIRYAVFMVLIRPDLAKMNVLLHGFSLRQVQPGSIFFRKMFSQAMNLALADVLTGRFKDFFCQFQKDGSSS